MSNKPSQDGELFVSHGRYSRLELSFPSLKLYHFHSSENFIGELNPLVPHLQIGNYENLGQFTYKQ